MKAAQIIRSRVVLALALGVASPACSQAPAVAPAPDGGAGGQGSGGAGGNGGSQPDASAPDPSDALFDPAHVLDVVIDLAPADWDALRFQGRSVADELGEGCQDGDKPNPFTQFPATVTIDGVKLEMSAVRKKGFFGSASLSKPSLKISFDEYLPGREHAGAEGLTLNNSQQDPSFAKTCLALDLFRKAGLPASRCNHATVTVNGAKLGVYVNVEPVKKRMLAHFFTDTTGNLYEGQLSDLRPGFSATYEKKTNADSPDRGDLDAITAALSANDAELVGALGEVVDLGKFTRFWAMEALLAAWDGYTGNLNNHFIYNDPTSKKMVFFPWGPDMSFSKDDPFNPSNRPQSVSAKGVLAERLYALPSSKQAYVAEMGKLLDEVWKEAEILGEIDRVQALLAPYPGAGTLAADATTSAVRAFVEGRRATILAEIVPSAPTWPYPPPSSGCLAEVGIVSGTFSTTFDTLANPNPFATGTGVFHLTLTGGAPMTATEVGAAAGYESGKKGRRQINVLGKFPDGSLRAVVFQIDPEVFAPGKEAPYDWQSIFALALDIPAPGKTKLMGLFGDGKLHLDEASTVIGAKVSGSFTGSLLVNPFN